MVALMKSTEKVAETKTVNLSETEIKLEKAKRRNSSKVWSTAWKVEIITLIGWYDFCSFAFVYDSNFTIPAIGWDIV